MTAPAIYDIETKDRVHFFVPGFVIDEEMFMDWDGANEHVRVRPDHGYILGNYCQLGPGDASSANSNGNVFAVEDTDETLVQHTPINMLHRRRHAVGTWVAAAKLGLDNKPQRAIDTLQLSDAAAPNKHRPFPYVQSLGAVWRWHFPDEWHQIDNAAKDGALFLSMEAIAEALKCLTAGCCDMTYPFDGLRSKTYCDSLNMPRAKKRLVKPHFLGGAAIIPPAMPGWRGADASAFAASLEEHPEEAERLYAQLAASDADSRFDKDELEVLTALLLSGAFDGDTDRIELDKDDVDRVFHFIMKKEGLDDGFITADEARAAAKAATGVETSTTEAPSGDRKAAGLAIIATDTGRTLMLQRCLTEDDPAAGTWEWPGGVLEPGETPYVAAVREWEEEIGCPLPPGEVLGSWVSDNGVYECFIYAIDHEADVNLGDRCVTNPDDPDGDIIEAKAWFDPTDLPGMPALRPEAQTSTDWRLLYQHTGAPRDQLAMQVEPTRVNYRGSQGGSTTCCANCVYFCAGDQACQIVAGPISPQYVCDLFTPDGSAPPEVVSRTMAQTK